MIAVIDYGAGNLFSVKNALDYLKIENSVAESCDAIEKADGIILPGVGAFPDAIKLLKEKGLFDAIRQIAAQKPILGICLGMQMLFERSDEFEDTEGLGLIKGYVSKISFGDNPPLKIPHMGYNELEFVRQSPLTEGIEGGYVYFVHSYMAYTDIENVCCYCDYNVKIPALVSAGNVFGAQFHPEKSGEIGLAMLNNFARLVKNRGI